MKETKTKFDNVLGEEREYILEPWREPDAAACKLTEMTGIPWRASPMEESNESE